MLLNEGVINAEKYVYSLNGNIKHFHRSWLQEFCINLQWKVLKFNHTHHNISPNNVGAKIKINFFFYFFIYLTNLYSRDTAFYIISNLLPW